MVTIFFIGFIIEMHGNDNIYICCHVGIHKKAFIDKMFCLSAAGINDMHIDTLTYYSKYF